HQQQYRRIEPDVGVLSCASASRGAAQVRWRPAMCCDDYPGAVVLTAPSNKRLKLTARRLGNESSFSAPRLKRDPLGAASVDRDHPTRVNDRSRGRDAKAHHVEHGYH